MKIFFACAFMVASLAGAQPTAPRVRITEDLRLDANTEDFSAFSRISVGPRREIVVPLQQDMQIRMYDSTGKRIASVGRRGSGPGEFQALFVGGWMADTMWAYDLRARRTTFISPAGEILRSEMLPAAVTPRMAVNQPAGQINYFTPGAMYADGSVFGEARFAQEQKPGTPYVWPTRALIRVAASGAIRVVGTPPRIEDDRWWMTVEIFGNTVPFAALPQTVHSMDGSRFAYLTTDITSREGGAFTVSLFRSNGDTLFVKTFPFRGTPIPQRVVDSVLAAMIPRSGRASEGPPDMPQRFQAIAKQKMPPVYAPVQSLIVGLDGTVWVTLRPTADGQIALILNNRGTPVGSVLVPPRSRIAQGSATHVWMTETDADGLTSVVRYKMAGVGCAPPECR